MIFYLLVIIIALLVIIACARAEKLGGGGAAEFTIYYSPDCKYCLLALELLRDKRADFTAIKIDDFPALLKRMKGKIPAEHRTKPIIFRRGKFLGGYTDLAKYYDRVAK